MGHQTHEWKTENSGRADKFTFSFHQLYLPTMISRITWSIGFSYYLLKILLSWKLRVFSILNQKDSYKILTNYH